MSQWSSCSKTCGPGTQQRLVQTPANYGGLQCPSQLTKRCSLKNCPVNCVVSQWSSCSKTCGPGTQQRSVQTPANYGGLQCPSQLTKRCSLKNCPGSLIMVATGSPRTDKNQMIDLTSSSTACANL